MKSLASLVLIAPIVLAAPAGAASLVVNGSFEQPGGVGAFSLLPAGSTFLPGWTAVDATLGGDNEVQYTNNGAFGGVGVVASDGAYFVDLTGVTGRGKGLKSDAIAVAAGATYRLAFDVGAFFVRGSGSFGDSIVDLRINDAPSGSFTNLQSLTAPGSDWQRFTYDFVAAGPSVRLTFLSSTSLASSNLGVGLDRVTLEAVSAPAAPAPEPAAWALMITGFGGMGAVARVRRRRSLTAPG